ncbi:Hypothetical predicted protein, partial [Pelobates cultripes]
MAAEHSLNTRSLPLSYRPHQKTATDTLQRLEEIFLRFWEKLDQRIKTAQTNPQTKTHA